VENMVLVMVMEKITIMYMDRKVRRSGGGRNRYITYAKGLLSENYTINKFAFYECMSIQVYMQSLSKRN
jgi:hypothetical protein